MSLGRARFYTRQMTAAINPQIILDCAGNEARVRFAIGRYHRQSDIVDETYLRGYLQTARVYMYVCTYTNTYGGGRERKGKLNRGNVISQTPALAFSLARACRHSTISSRSSERESKREREREILVSQRGREL